jgi:hypothetical protein
MASNLTFSNLVIIQSLLVSRKKKEITGLLVTSPFYK